MGTKQIRHIKGLNTYIYEMEQEKKKNALVSFFKAILGEEVEVEETVVEETPEATTYDAPESEGSDTMVAELSEAIKALTEKVEGFEAKLAEVAAERDEAVKEVEEIKASAKELIAELSETPAVETPARVPSRKPMSKKEIAIQKGKLLLKK